jgi:NAD-dependent oxidoreductase involved in siderophore biosynthesis
MKLNDWPCPAACNSSSDFSTWFEYHNVKDLAVCDEPLLLTFNLYAPIDDPNTHATIRACTVGDDESTTNFLGESGYVSPDAKGPTNFGPTVRRRDDSAKTNTTCGVGSAPESNSTSHLASWETENTLSDSAAQDVVVAAQTLKESVQKTAVTCDERKNLFAY